MELTASFVDQLQHFVPVFTTPTFQTFLQIVTGWVLCHRHRYLTEVIFAGGNVGNGHWCRFHRFFADFRGRLTCLIHTQFSPWTGQFFPVSSAFDRFDLGVL
jgi:hypothetical protein